MQRVNVYVVTDQNDADGSYHDVSVRANSDGTLIISRNGKDLAWYAPGKWVKVDFQ